MEIKSGKKVTKKANDEGIDTVEHLLCVML